MKKKSLLWNVVLLSKPISSHKALGEEADNSCVRFPGVCADTALKGSETSEVFTKSAVSRVKLLSVALAFSLVGCVNNDNLSGDNKDDEVDGSVSSSDSTKDKEEFNLDKEHVPGELIVKFKPGFSGSSSQKASAANIRDASLVQEVLSRFNGKPLHTFKSLGAQLISFADTKKQGKGIISNKGKSVGDTQDDSDRLLEIARELEQMPNVEYVEANLIVTAYSQSPNDPEFGMLYGMQAIQAPEAWDITTGSREVLVGVIDSGIQYNHPDLKDNIWANPGETGVDSQGNDKSTNGVDDDGNGYVDDFRGWDFNDNDNDPIDEHGHGSHVAGTIGAMGNNETGIVGVNWQVSMVPIKVLDESGHGTISSITRGIEYATSLGVDVTNNSYGWYNRYSQTVKDVIEKANDADILFVTAAGNERVNNDISFNYPANYDVPNIITVAATDVTDDLWVTKGTGSGSNYGAETVHLSAPGHDIYSTSRGLTLNLYVKMTGTSMATPHVVGAVALIKAAYPELSGAAIKERIMRNVDRVGDSQTKTIAGGRLNVYKALVDDSTPPALVRDLSVVNQTPSSITISWKQTGDDGFFGEAARYEARLSDHAIETDSEWEAAKLIDADVILGSGRTMQMTTELEYNSTGFIAIRAFDDVDNMSPISESLQFDLAIAPHFCGTFGKIKTDFRRLFEEGLCEDKLGEYLANPDRRFSSRDLDMCCDLHYDGTFCPYGKEFVNRGGSCMYAQSKYGDQVEETINSGRGILFAPYVSQRDIINCCE